jgi:signal transduction histidine kinase
MPFKVSARMILELGAELIGSDGVAFYELIKNAFDAESSHVEVDIISRVKLSVADDLYSSTTKAEEAGKKPQTSVEFRELRGKIADCIPDITEADEFLSTVEKAKTWLELRRAIDLFNYIRFTDYGLGMTLPDLTDVYLVLGTRHRQREKSKRGASDRPVLGEKGIGRLSAMRLGRRLTVRTATKMDKQWNVLDIDWRRFTHDSDELLEEIPVAPLHGELIRKGEKIGTSITISALRRDWSRRIVDEIAENDVNKFIDPFVKGKVFPISIRFNDDPVSIPRFDRSLFEHSHANVTAKFRVHKSGAELSGHVVYSQKKREQAFSVSDEHLASVTECDLMTLQKLGPFDVEFYWYNRRILDAIDGIGDRKRVRALVNDWSGGLSVYRDGFRVLPYGSPDDDWLNLDQKALASQGYKVNRKQLIGKVDVSSVHNPALTDQTNREGLRDCEEKRALQSLLRHILEVPFRAFLNSVDKETKTRKEISFDDIQKRMESASQRMESSVSELLRAYPDIRQDTEISKSLRETTSQVAELILQAEELSQAVEHGRSEMLHLAGVGAMVEFVAHELNRAAQNALSTLADRALTQLPDKQKSLIDTLRSQMKTLQKRLRILDPLSTSGRQVKESFDVAQWLKEIVGAHESQFERHGIQVLFSIHPPRGHLRVKMVKGMMVQVFENLISNSVYWLKQRKILQKSFSPQITIGIDVESMQISFADNGPGIEPDRAEEVFQAFVTTKPPGRGKGVGLYISREIATYHDAELFLSEDDINSDGNLSTIVLDISKAGQKHE